MSTPASPTSTSRSLPASLASHPGFLLAKAHHRAHELANEALAPLGLTIKHFGCLTVIADEGPISQQSLGESMRVDRTTMVAVVDELESGGYVVRRRNPDDRRAYALEATEAGSSWLADAREALLVAERALLAGLEREEQEELAGLLQKLLTGERGQ
jgi:MarR family transcriptional regulator, transcriptional regulator for hemolysin